MVLQQGVCEAAGGGQAPVVRATRGVRISADGCEHTFRADAIADYNRYLLYLSFAGSSSLVKAVRAVLGQPDIHFNMACVEYEDPFGPYHPFARDGDGYRSYSKPLGLHTWHMVLVSKRPGLMLSMDDESIWQELTSARYTTPILRKWMPYILEKLKEYDYRLGGRGIVDADCWGCKPGVLTCTDEYLDAIVTEGLKNGALTI